MKKEEVKIGMDVFFKQDYEENGTVVKLPDSNGDVLIDGGDSEEGPQEFLIHYSRLDHA